MNFQGKEIILLLSFFCFWIVVVLTGFYIYRKMRGNYKYENSIPIVEAKAQDEQHNLEIAQLEIQRIKENLEQNTSGEMLQKLNDLEKRIKHLEKKGQ